MRGSAGSDAPRHLTCAARIAIVAVGLALVACENRSLPDGHYLAAVQRLVPSGERAGPLTLGRPIAAVHDETRYVLAAPPLSTVVWPREVDDRRGNRIHPVSVFLKEELREATALVVRPRVKVGNEWIQPPPEIIQTHRGETLTTMEIDFPIPANPGAGRVIVSAVAYPIGLVDLTDLRTSELRVPGDAVLEFGIGVVEPDWGYDPVEFRVEECDAQGCREIFRETFDPMGDEGPRWRDRRVALDALVGETRQLRFRARRLSEDARFSFPVWSNPTIYAPAPRPERARNVILLSIDTLRADHLTTYGYVHDTAPFIERRFGRKGTVFEHPLAAATLTTPSHASMFTSLQPATHGTLDGLKVLPKNVPTLAELVRDAGLDTAAVTENGWLGVQHGFGRGFDTYVENKSPSIMNPDGQADVTFDMARQWLERNRDKRFFLFLHTFQVHTPYSPPAEYRHLFREHTAGTIGSDSPSHLRWMAEYDQEIRYTDDELARLFATIDRLGLGRDTVFILTSDHGEAFLEHGILEHGGPLYDEVVRVPLLLWGAGVPRDRRVKAPVTHIDLMPTILELLGVPMPNDREGSSLLGLMNGSEAAARFEERELFSESTSPWALGAERTLVGFEPTAYLVRRGTRKLARYPLAEGGHRFEYYDVETDPQELVDLYPTRATEARDLAEALAGYEARSRALRAKIDAGTDSDDEDAPRVHLDPDQEAKLRALGYLE